jgi:very-short-patch-repair endonuclease
MSRELTPGKADVPPILTRAELLSSGRSPERIRSQLRAGTLVRVTRGLYAVAAAAAPIQNRPDGNHLLAAAAALRALGPGFTASHHTAAVIHDLDLLRRPATTVALTRPLGQGRRQLRPGVRLHVANLPAGHVTARLGLRVTTVARTVVDLARASEFRAGVVVADSALRARQTTRAELHQLVAECRGWPGIATAAEVVAFADEKSESALESIARVLFRDCKLPPPELQVWVGGVDVVGRADFYWRHYATIAEVDGGMKYTAPEEARRRLQRDARLREAGFEVVHFDWYDITRRPEHVASSIRAAFERGARGLGAGFVAG